MKTKGEPVPNDKSPAEKTIEQLELAIAFLEWEAPEESITKLRAAFEHVKKVLREEDNAGGGSKTR